MTNPSSLLERFLGTCVTVLVAALALNWAVHLLLEVWRSLAVIGAVVLAVTAGFMVWRSRRGGW
jgi:K+ transporter